MGNRFSGLIVTAAIAATASAAISVSVTRTSAQAPAVSGVKTPPLKTAWGEPDLQGIWTNEFDTPLQRSAKYANQEFFTEAQRAELDQARQGILDRRATERDVNNGYNGAAFFSMKRNDGPEDSSLAERCLTGGPIVFGGDTGSFRRIVQTPGGVSIFYDVGQGQGWQRNVVMDGRPHLPASSRQWYGDSRGRWEGATLVVDVTNFSPKTEVFGARENLHLLERWTRTGPRTLAYEVTIEDPTVWTRPWTVKQEFSQQSNEENRFYTEPRCLEGNYGLPGLLHGRRVEDAAFAQGQIGRA